MKAKLDYSFGPALGHRRRCEILTTALLEGGHSIVDDDSFDWLVVDYPTIPTCPELKAGQRRLVMGTVPQKLGDFAWAPLHIPHSNTLTGKEYLILSPRLADVQYLPKQERLLITCGSTDPLHLTEQLLVLLPEGGTVVIGSGFRRNMVIPRGWHIQYDLSHERMITTLATHTVICAWGNTAFELCYLGSKFIAIAIQDEHLVEAASLGVPILKPTELDQISDLLPRLDVVDYGIDLNGANRTVRFMESKCSA